MNLSDETQLGRDLRRLVEDQPFRPDLDAIGLRARKRRQRGLAVRGAVSAGAAVVVAGGLVAALHGPGGSAGGAAAGRPDTQPGTDARVPAATSATLMSLAASVTTDGASPPGDASVVVTIPSLGGTPMGATYELYTDSGDIYWAQSGRELAAAVASHQTMGDPQVTAEVAAAKYAATGNLATAREKTAAILAPLERKGILQGERQKSWIKNLLQDPALFQEKLKENPGARTNTSAGGSAAEVAANSIWNVSVDALTAGGGSPRVRAGVLRLLSTVPGIKVTSSTSGGEATLTLTAGSSVFGGSAPEMLTIDARTGSPVRFSAAAGGGMQAAAATYRVSRVTLSDVAKGKF